MKEQRDEKWLDELIAGNIDTTEPRFDTEGWKKKYSREFQALIERSSRPSSAGHTGILRLVFSVSAVKVAAAAVLIVSISLLIAYLGPGEQQQTIKSPAEMVTAMSLRMAYRDGGMEALQRQCDHAAKVLGFSSKSSSLGDLFTDSNG